MDPPRRIKLPLVRRSISEGGKMLLFSEIAVPNTLLFYKPVNGFISVILKGSIFQISIKSALVNHIS